MAARTPFHVPSAPLRWSRLAGRPAALLRSLQSRLALTSFGWASCQTDAPRERKEVPVTTKRRWWPDSVLGTFVVGWVLVVFTFLVIVVFTLWLLGLIF
jgi:hypothetical protein